MSIFFDHNSTTALNPEVLKVMIEIYQKPYNNSAVHQLGRQAQSIVENAKNVIKKALERRVLNFSDSHKIIRFITRGILKVRFVKEGIINSSNK